MAGKLYSLLAVFMHYAEKPEPEKDAHVTYVEKALTYIETNYSYPVTVEDIAYYVGISRSHLFPFLPALHEQVAKRISDRVPDQTGLPSLKRNGSLGIGHRILGGVWKNNLYFSKAFRKQKGLSLLNTEKKKAKMTGEK